MICNMNNQERKTKNFMEAFAKGGDARYRGSSMKYLDYDALLEDVKLHIKKELEKLGYARE